MNKQQLIRIAEKTIKTICFITLISFMVNRCFYGTWLCHNDKYRKLSIDGIIIKKEKRKIAEYRTPTFIVIQMKTLADTIVINAYGGNTN